MKGACVISFDGRDIPIAVMIDAIQRGLSSLWVVFFKHRGQWEYEYYIYNPVAHDIVPLSGDELLNWTTALMMSGGD